MDNGDFIRIEFVGRLESGEIFDLTDEALAKKENIYNSNYGYKPLPIIIGEGMVIKGLDEVFLSMQIGDEKDVEIEPDKAFGNRDPSLVRVLPEKSFKEKPIQGMIVDFGNLKGRVQSINAGRVRVDFNNPLSGKKLKYHIKILEQITDTENQVKAVIEYFGGDADIIIKDGVVDVHEIPKKQGKDELRMSPPLKKRISEIILKNMKDLNEVHFVEVFKQTPQK
ncbi:MAG: peptidylprolyl isomerase [Candidatus Aenigmatarchaeota archaeon]